jgi:hypothetical protein
VADEQGVLLLELLVDVNAKILDGRDSQKCAAVQGKMKLVGNKGRDSLNLAVDLHVENFLFHEDRRAS